MPDVDKTMSRKIPCGEKPERYPRTDFKKYNKSSIWDKMGPTAKNKPQKEHKNG